MKTESRQAKSLTIFLKNSLYLIAMALISLSCSRVRYDAVQFTPQWHVGDHEKNSIVFRDENLYNRVFSNEPRFNEYACMHQLKIAELRSLIRRARVPKSVQLNEKEISELNNLNDEIQKKLDINWIQDGQDNKAHWSEQ